MTEQKTEKEILNALDFQPNVKKAVPCDVFESVVREGKPKSSNRQNCTKEAEVMAIRGCCGALERLCVSCHNASSSSGNHRCKFGYFSGNEHRTVTPRYSQVMPL